MSVTKKTAEILRAFLQVGLSDKNLAIGQCFTQLLHGGFGPVLLRGRQFPHRLQLHEGLQSRIRDAGRGTRENLQVWHRLHQDRQNGIIYRLAAGHCTVFDILSILK